MKEWFDTSDYPPDHPLHSLANKKVIGKFKDEMNGTPVKSFIGVRPKMYSFKTSDGGSKRVGKGIPRSALKGLTHEDYEKAINRPQTSRIYNVLSKKGAVLL